MLRTRTRQSSLRVSMTTMTDASAIHEKEIHPRFFTVSLSQKPQRLGIYFWASPLESLGPFYSPSWLLRMKQNSLMAKVAQFSEFIRLSFLSCPGRSSVSVMSRTRPSFMSCPGRYLVLVWRSVLSHVQDWLVLVQRSVLSHVQDSKVSRLFTSSF